MIPVLDNESETLQKRTVKVTELSALFLHKLTFFSEVKCWSYGREAEQKPGRLHVHLLAQQPQVKMDTKQMKERSRGEILPNM